MSINKPHTAEPSTTRRRFLRGLGLSAAASAAVAAPALASASEVRERPEMLSWEGKLERLAETYTATRTAKKEAIKHYHSLCPVPEELVVNGEPDRLRFSSTPEQAWNGDRIKDETGWQRDIITLSDLNFDAQDYSARTKFGKLIREKIKVAEAYERVKQEAEVTSGVREAAAAFSAAEKALDEAIKAVMAVEPRTLAGVAIKSRALLAYASTAPETSGMSWVSLKYGNRLAADLLAVTQPGAQG